MINKGNPIPEGVNVLNVFCPTGKGGGVNPTCSPGNLKRRSIENNDKAGTLLINPTVLDAVSFIENKITRPAGSMASLKGIKDVEGNWYVWDGYKATHSDLEYDLGLPEERTGGKITARFEIQDATHTQSVRSWAANLKLLGFKESEIVETISSSPSIHPRGRGSKTDKLVKGLTSWTKKQGQKQLLEYGSVKEQK